MSQYNLGGVAFPGGHTASEPSDPWRSNAPSTSSEAGPAAPADEPHTSSTPKVSGVVRNSSPIALPEFTTPQTWKWQGIPYATIEAATDATAPNTIPNDVKGWTMNMVAQIGTLSTNNERLIKLNNSLTLEAQAIRKDFEDYKDEVKGQMDTLYGNMVALKEAQEKTMTYIIGLESRLNNAIINAPSTGIQPLAGQSSQSPHRIKLPDPPKYSGRKSSKNFETWFTNLLIWLDYNHFMDDKDKIRQANVHLEGGAALYMKECAIKLASGQDVGTWAEYTRKLEMTYKMLDPKCTA
ncbi:uncharacterized protein LAESUDRAFT_765136 [Laetiporus sulphureus 93-53]|uniref:Retrotransposon gag domain-containing protein n=1 Tax=Laetiporus sulphureus 93-53 TaxID=1314785 RepID=A0A165AXW9_9APHY|nr:uncharacterized protein LAESUDRAFT_765136 [Laetiporus sulphureus 93-53]KZS99866.1 hypothetical protein LAESUDRAFT_765136 [Laetiporus sulphureus 93-53]